GIAGLVKAVLAVRYGEIPAHLHFREPNPYIPWERLPVRVVTERERWPEGAERIAGVSSFGFSGTNAHVVVAAAPAAEPGERSGGEVDRPVHVLVVSGRKERALREYAGRYAERLGEGEEELSLADVAHTANTGRAQFGHRAAVVAETVEEARAALEAVAAGREAAGVIAGKVPPGDPPRVAFLFTGQGSQYMGMGRGLYESAPVFRDALERCDALPRGELEVPVLEVFYGGRGELSERPEYRHPAPCA